MARLSAPNIAKSYLRDAAYRLGASDPSSVREVSRSLDESLSLPVGDPNYWRDPPLTSSFAEERSGMLDMLIAPLGPLAGPADRTEAATRTMEDIVGAHFGRDARRWLDGRIEPVAHGAGRTVRWGAHLGTSFDRNGVRESMVTYEWGPDLVESFPDTLYRLTRVALDLVPGLRPAYTSVRCGRTSGSQQVIFAVDAPLTLNAMKPLMDSLGLGDKHAGLMSAVAFILGARFTLPPGSCNLTLRPTRAGVELRLDIDLAAVPDLPPQLMSLLRLQLAERPQSVRAMDTWLIAMTPDGYDHPGTLSILSVCVRPDMPARIALHIRPPVLETPPADEQPTAPGAAEPQPAGASPGSGIAAQPGAELAPAGAGAESGSVLPATASAVYAYPR